MRLRIVLYRIAKRSRPSLTRRVHPRWRNSLIAIAMALLAVWNGSSLASGSYAPAFLCAIGCGALLIIWGGWMQIEALLLTFVLVGYVIGNRGFAQIMPYPRLPLLFGEAVLAAGGLIVFVQAAFRRELPFRRDALNTVLLLLITLGSARMLIDFPRHGFWSLRDFAVIYYIGYFFVAQQVAHEPRARRHIGDSFIAATALLPFVFAAFELFPDFFLSQLTLRGVPVIFMKADLVATFLIAGLFPVIAAPPGRNLTVWRWAAGGALLVTGLGLLSRSAFLGLLVAGLFSFAGGRSRLFRVAAFALPIGVIVALGVAVAQQQPWRETRLYGLYEHIVSIADVRGQGVYEGTVSVDTGDNNRFRIVWWQAITDRVIVEKAFFGLGFGYDLSRDFTNIYAGVEDDFNVRSPHSIVFTVLGRTGWFGLALFVGLVGVMVARTRTAAKAVRSQLDGAELALAWWCACWVILVSACFGVVLENPMGAVVFWILLGLAHASTNAVTDAAAAADAKETHDPSLQTTAEPAIR